MPKEVLIFASKNALKKWYPCKGTPENPGKSGGKWTISSRIIAKCHKLSIEFTPISWIDSLNFPLVTTVMHKISAEQTINSNGFNSCFGNLLLNVILFFREKTKITIKIGSINIFNFKKDKVYAMRVKSIIPVISGKNRFSKGVSDIRIIWKKTLPGI